MIRERDPFGRALRQLRSKLKAGDFAQGEPLTIVELARELDLSPTPVREALSRLAGEGQVEDRRGRGYFSWRLDGVDLVELYDLNALYVGATIQRLMTSGPPGLDSRFASKGEGVAADYGQATEALFLEIMRAAGSRALLACQEAVSARLAPIWRVEPLVIDGAEAEVAGLIALHRAGDWRASQKAIGRFHDRRRAVASEIARRNRRK